MLVEEFHRVDRRSSIFDLTYSPYFEEFGRCPEDTELADEVLAKNPDPITRNY